MGKIKKTDLESHEKIFNSSHWVFNEEFNFLNKFIEILKMFYNETEKTLKNNNIINLKSDLFEFAENIIFLENENINVNSNNPKDKKVVESKKKIRLIIQYLVFLDFEKTLIISIKFKCLFSISFICNKYKTPEKLKEYFKQIYSNFNLNGNNQNYKCNQADLTKAEEEIEYMLRVYLFLDVEEIKNKKKVPVFEFEENNKRPSDNLYYFEFFSTFFEFNNIILKVIKPFPKLQFYYQIFMKTKGISLFSDNKSFKFSYWSSDSNLDELLNKIKDPSVTDAFIKILKLYISKSDNKITNSNKKQKIWLYFLYFNLIENKKNLFINITENIIEKGHKLKNQIFKELEDSKNNYENLMNFGNDAIYILQLINILREYENKYNNLLEKGIEVFINS